MKKNNFTQNNSNGNFSNNASGSNYSSFYNANNAKNSSNANNANSATSGYSASDVDKFSNMSEDELLNQMFNIAKQKKDAGELTNADLDSFLATASSVLQPSQKEKLQSLINMIKD
ncbi:MAG: hypothetical protein RSB10_03140 [Clostridia bacterium]